METLLVGALTGPLDGIAQVLVRDLGIYNAIVLDNGGSVGVKVDLMHKAGLKPWIGEWILKKVIYL